MNEDLLFDLADRLQHRYYGKYRGCVVDVDPTTLRVKAVVPAVLGDTPTGWCLPCVPYAGPGVGMFFVPPQGASVWIEFEGGDPSYPIWVGCFWSEGELPPQATPTTRGIVTAAPHELLFDDDAAQITLADANGGSIAFTGGGVLTSRGAGSVDVGGGGVAINGDALTVT